GGRVELGYFDRQLRDARAVPRRRSRRAIARAAARGAPRAPHLPRRGHDRLRGRVLPLQRPLHVGAAGAGADADQDRRHAMAAFYVSAMPREQIERHGIDPDALRPVADAFAAGAVERGVELMRPELAEKLSCAGTPEEILEQIQRDVVPSGFNHVILALTDPY